MKKFILPLLGIIIVLVIGVTIYTAKVSDTKTPWSAVFLSNGQVYFGHIATIKSDTLILENIYYLQAQRSLQPSEDKDQGLSLSKLGRFELHCPQDRMTINREQVLFWEDLKNDSKVVKAIDEYLKTDDIKKDCYSPQS